MNTTPKFSEYLDSFTYEDENRFTYPCERYRVGTERPKTYVLMLKRSRSKEAHTTGNISGFEVYQVNASGEMVLIPLKEQKPWLVNALNQARVPIIKELKRIFYENRAKHKAHLISSGFYQSKEYSDWRRKNRFI